MRNRQTGFSLVELLVVITIIVVLIALLIPAMEKAVYQAELAMCGSRLHGIALGAATYAAGSQRRYPDRVNLWFAGRINDAGANDLREICRGYLAPGLFLDPLSPKVDYSEQAAPRTSHVISSYDLRFGWRFSDEKGMMRTGDRWAWRGQRFSVLASDADRQARGVFSIANHADAAQLLNPFTDQTGLLVFSRWQNLNGLRRGTIDMNFAYEDGSVKRWDRVPTNDELDSPTLDERMSRVPFYYDSTNNNWPAEWQNVPKEN